MLSVLIEFLVEHQPHDEGVWPFNYHTVNQPWQIGAGASMGLRIVCTNGVPDRCGPTVALRRPNVSTLKNTLGDGNGMFRVLSYLIKGTQRQYGGVCDAIVRHLLQNDDLFMCSTQVGVNLRYHSLSEYITTTGMANNKQWGTEVKLFATSHLPRTKVYTYSRDGRGGKFTHPVTLTPHYKHLKAVLMWEYVSLLCT